MRIRPYIKDGDKLSEMSSKFKPSENGRTAWEKLECKNANRSLKKGYRQLLKRETDDLLEEYYKNKNNNDEK